MVKFQMGQHGMSSDSTYAACFELTCNDIRRTLLFIAYNSEYLVILLKICTVFTDNPKKLTGFVKDHEIDGRCVLVLTQL